VSEAPPPIRAATRDDAAAVATVQVRSWRVAYRGQLRLERRHPRGPIVGTPHRLRAGDAKMRHRLNRRVSVAPRQLRF